MVPIYRIMLSMVSGHSKEWTLHNSTAGCWNVHLHQSNGLTSFQLKRIHLWEEKPKKNRWKERAQRRQSRIKPVLRSLNTFSAICQRLSMLFGDYSNGGREYKWGVHSLITTIVWVITRIYDNTGVMIMIIAAPPSWVKGHHFCCKWARTATV